MKPSRSPIWHHLALALLCLLALGVRFAIARHYQSKLAPDAAFEFGDSQTYWDLGLTIYRGRDYAYGPREYRVMRTPGYPALLAGLMRTMSGAATPWHARILSVALGVASVIVTYVAARCMFDARVGLIAASIATFAPCAIASSVFVLAEAPFIPVMVAQLACWWGWLTTDSPRRAQLLATAVGILAGAGVLIRPSWLLFTPLALLAMHALRWRQPTYRALQLAPAVVCVLVFVLTLAPWWVRNERVSGRFIATTLQAGPSLYDGWRPDADGASDMRFVEAFEARADLDDSIPKKGIERELMLDRQMSDAAWAWAVQNPGRVVKLAAIKFLRTWNVVPNFAEMQSPIVRAAVFLGYTPVLVTALLGAWRFRGRQDVLFVCLFPAIYFSVLHMVYVGSLRYRQPAMFPLFILSAAWITDVFLHAGRQPFAPQGRGEAI